MILGFVLFLLAGVFKASFAQYPDKICDYTEVFKKEQAYCDSMYF